MQSADATPAKRFDRTETTEHTEIVSYRVSKDGMWSALIGIAPGNAEKCVSVPSASSAAAASLSRHLSPRAHCLYRRPLHTNRPLG